MSLDYFDPKNKHYLDVREGKLVPADTWDVKAAVRVINFFAQANIREHFGPQNISGASRLLADVARIMPRVAKDKPIAEMVLRIISENDKELFDFLSPFDTEIFRRIAPHQHKVKKLLPVLKSMNREMQLECLQRPDLIEDLTKIYNRFPDNSGKAEEQILLVLQFLEIASHGSHIKEQYLLFSQLEDVTKQEIHSYRLNSLMKIFNTLEKGFGKEGTVNVIDQGLSVLPESALLDVLEYLAAPDGIQHFMRTLSYLPNPSVDLTRVLLFRGLTTQMDLKQDLLEWSKKPGTLASVQRSLILTIDSIRYGEQWEMVKRLVDTHKDLLHVNEHGVIYQRLDQMEFLLDPEQRNLANHPFNLENTCLRKQAEQKEVAKTLTHLSTQLNNRPVRVVLEEFRQGDFSSPVGKKIRFGLECYFRSIFTKPQFLEKVCGKEVEGYEAKVVSNYLSQRLYSVFGLNIPYTRIDWNTHLIPIPVVQMSTPQLADLFCSCCDGDHLCGSVRTALSTPQEEMSIEDAEQLLFDAGLFIR